MTLNDLLKRVNIELDKDKMLLWSDGIGWSNLEIEISDDSIKLLPYKQNSPFSSEN